MDSATTLDYIIKFLPYLIGGGGLIGGFIMLYKAKPEREGLEISNEGKELDNEAKEVDMTSIILKQVQEAIRINNEANAKLLESSDNKHKEDYNALEKNYNILKDSNEKLCKEYRLVKKEVKDLSEIVNNVQELLKEALDCEFPPKGTSCPMLYRFGALCPHANSEKLLTDGKE